MTRQGPVPDIRVLDHAVRILNSACSVGLERYQLTSMSMLLVHISSNKKKKKLDF